MAGYSANLQQAEGEGERRGQGSGFFHRVADSLGSENSDFVNCSNAFNPCREPRIR